MQLFKQLNKGNYSFSAAAAQTGHSFVMTTSALICKVKISSLPISIGLEPLQYFEIKRMKWHCMIISTELTEGKLKSFAKIPGRAVLSSLLIPELQP